MNLPAGTGASLFKRIQEQFSVCFVTKNRLLPIPTAHDVVVGSGIFNSRLPGHKPNAKQQGRACQYLNPRTDTYDHLRPTTYDTYDTYERTDTYDDTYDLRGCLNPRTRGLTHFFTLFYFFFTFFTIFYRTSMLFGAGMQPPIFLNGKKVGISKSGIAFYVDADPGEYKASIDKILYPGKEGGVDFKIQENEVVYVRTWTGGGSLAGKTDAGVMSREQAEPHTKDLKFLRYDFDN